MLGKIDDLAEKRRFWSILGGLGAVNTALVEMEAISYKNISLLAITNNFY